MEKTLTVNNDNNDILKSVSLCLERNPEPTPECEGRERKTSGIKIDWRA